MIPYDCMSWMAWNGSCFTNVNLIPSISLFDESGVLPVEGMGLTINVGISAPL
jgi:hypothetical protein